ncbi:MAG TPA: AMP-binding protein, partial [Terracidiphilus sp.]|nr:AMP-binding protein [Terracidiphilus sp.]
MRFGKQNLRPDLPIDRDLASFIEAQVAASPDAVAIRMGQRALTFRELNEQSNRLAHYLRQQHVGPGKIVGVLIDRSVEMVVCLLGILKSGGVYLPLDPKFPKDRLAFMIADAEASVLLTQLSYREELPATNATIVALEDFNTLLAASPIENPQPVNNPRDIAYVIYTSGSTGNPKGVMIPRRALANFLLSMAEEPGMTAQDKLLAVTTISFDISFLEMLLPLITGAQIVVVQREQAGDPFALRQLLDEHNISVMQATPTTWRLLLESGWEGKPNLK